MFLARAVYCTIVWYYCVDQQWIKQRVEFIAPLTSIDVRTGARAGVHEVGVQPKGLLGPRTLRGSEAGHVWVEHILALDLATQCTRTHTPRLHFVHEDVVQLLLDLAHCAVQFDALHHLTSLSHGNHLIKHCCLYI